MRAIEEARLAYEAEVEAARLAKLKARKREQDLVNMATLAVGLLGWLATACPSCHIDCSTNVWW